MEAKSKKPTSEHDSATNSEPKDLPERWSAPRKTELVLQLPRGDSLDSVSRDSQVPAHELESWKRAFLDAGMRGLKRHVEPEDRELIRTRAKIGELMMRLELAEDLIEKRGLVEEWKSARHENLCEPRHRTPLPVAADLRGLPAGALERLCRGAPAATGAHPAEARPDDAVE